MAGLQNQLLRNWHPRTISRPHADGLLIIQRLPSVRNTRALPNRVERPLCFPRIR